MADQVPTWLSSWTVASWGIGGSSAVLRCPKANLQRPDRTPACYIELPESATIAELGQLAQAHRRSAHRS